MTRSRPSRTSAVRLWARVPASVQPAAGSQRAVISCKYDEPEVFSTNATFNAALLAEQFGAFTGNSPLYRLRG